VDSSTTNTPSGLGVRLRLIWLAARQILGRWLRGDILAGDKYTVFISYRHVEPDRPWAVSAGVLRDP
jgi:hypothetical protein